MYRESQLAACRVVEHRCILGQITYNNEKPRARAVVGKLEVISVLHRLKLDAQYILDSHLRHTPPKTMKHATLIIQARNHLERLK